MKCFYLKDYDELLTDLNERKSKMHALQKMLGSVLQDIKDVKNRASLLNTDASNLRQLILDETSDSATTENEVRLHFFHVCSHCGD